MKVQKISQNNAIRAQIKRSNANITGLGESAPQQTSPIDDKKANEAIKSNFLANVSFAGHTKEINFNHNQEYEAFTDTGSYKSKDLDCAIRKAITMSSDYQGGEIKKGEKSPEWRGYRTNPTLKDGYAEVYFADRGEKVYQNDLKKHSYVVLPEGAYISDFDSRFDEDCNNSDDEYGFHGWGWSFM